MEQKPQNPDDPASVRFGDATDASPVLVPKTTADERALKGFGDLPDLAAVSLNVASGVSGVSISTYRREARAGNLAPIVKLSAGRSGVIVGALRAKLRARRGLA